MKELIRTIQLKKFKTKLNEQALEKFTGQEFIVMFHDGAWARAYSKGDLLNILNHDDKKPIWYIFDMTDRITINRDILIDPADIIKS